jgi:probable HAF family extracellular repeat protein
MHRFAYPVLLLSALLMGSSIRAARAAPPKYSVTDLGTLGGTASNASGINASGQVTGTSDTTAELFDYHAFLWTPTTPNGTEGTIIDLGTLGGTYSEGKAINASGQVAGLSFMPGDSATGAFIWTPTTPNGTSGTLSDSSALGGSSSEAQGINDRGQVTGYF